MPKQYVLIEVDAFLDLEIKTAQALSDYLVNEFDNSRILNGTITAFEHKLDLKCHALKL